MSNNENIESLNEMMKNPERIVVSEEEFEKIQKMVNEPANPSDALRELMSREPNYKREF